MSIKTTEFGNVRVYVTTKDIVDTVSRVEVNWTAIGSVSVARSLEFQEDLRKALEFAASERFRLGITEDK